MSAAIKEAATNTVLRIAHLFEQNCALKHGLPKVDGPERVSGLKDVPPPKQEPPIVNITNEVPAAPAAPNSPSPGATVAADTDKHSLARTVAPWLLSAAVGAGLPTGYWWFSKDEETSLETPSERDGSLLQWLEDNFQHRPEQP